MGARKAAGEAAVLKQFPDAVILRPSLVFGPEDQLFNRFAAMAGYSPFLPLIGGGRTRFQPVYAGDVAAAIAAACAGRAKPHTIYELGGPEVVTFRELLDRTMAWSGRRRLYLRLPFWAAKLGALLTVPLPNGLRPLTVDQVRCSRPTTWWARSPRPRGARWPGSASRIPRPWRRWCPAISSAFSPTASLRTIGAETAGLDPRYVAAGSA